MINGEIIIKVKQTINNPGVKYSCILLLALAILCGGFKLISRIRTRKEIIKYETSIKMALDYYTNHSWNSLSPNVILEDAWRRPFHVEVDNFEKNIKFVSNGNNPKSEVDDLTIIVSRFSYTFEYSFGDHFNSEAVFHE